MKIHTTRNHPSTLFWILFGLFSLMALCLATFLPPTRVDSLVYHLVIPRYYLETNGMTEMPWNIYAYFPCLMELIYLLLMKCGVMSPQIAHAAIGIGCCGLTAILAHRISLRRNYCWLAVFAVLLTPEFFKEMTWAYVDLLNVFFWILGFLFFLRWETTRRPGLLIWIGAAAAGACSVKYTSLIYPLILGLLVCLNLRKSSRIDQRKGLIGLVGCALTFLLLTSWWWFRNWIWTGNPLFPFFGELFPSNHPVWNPERIRFFQTFVNQIGGAQQHGLLYRVAVAPLLFFSAIPSIGSRFDGTFNIWLLTGFLSLFWLKNNRPLQWIWILLLIKGAFWIFSSQQVRFALVSAPFLAVAAAFAVQSIKDRSPLSGRIMFLLFLAMCAINVIHLGHYFHKRGSFPAILAKDKTDYLRTNLPYWNMYEYIHANTPNDAMIGMVLTGAQTYYLHRPHQTETVFEEYILKQMIHNASTPEEIIEQMNRRGWDYLLVCFPFIQDPIWLETEHRAKLFRLFKHHLLPVFEDNHYVLYELPPPCRTPTQTGCVE